MIKNFEKIFLASRKLRKTSPIFKKNYRLLQVSNLLSASYLAQPANANLSLSSSSSTPSKAKKAVKRKADTSPGGSSGSADPLYTPSSSKLAARRESGRTVKKVILSCFASVVQKSKKKLDVSWVWMWFKMLSRTSYPNLLCSISVCPRTEEFSPGLTSLPSIDYQQEHPLIIYEPTVS